MNEDVVEASHGHDVRGAPLLLLLALSALGVVFGDLGTSPLYALQEAFHGVRGVAPTRDNVLGIVSLFLWALLLMVSVKYVAVLMRAGNRGEGGILALLALIIGDKSTPTRRAAVFTMLALIGTAMLYGDSFITPAVSVLSAVEGLQVATPALGPSVIPITVCILVLLFAVQPFALLPHTAEPGRGAGDKVRALDRLRDRGRALGNQRCRPCRLTPVRESAAPSPESLRIAAGVEWRGGSRCGAAGGTTSLP
jgi:hypothetical protein